MIKTPKGIVILGSTGSIGQSTLDVVARHPDKYRVVGLVAAKSDQIMLEQIQQHRPDFAVMTDIRAGNTLKSAVKALGLTTVVASGEAIVNEFVAAPEVSCVMAAIVGSAGLLPTLTAARHGKTILLANKEALVMAGDVFLREARASGAKVLPIDSEHNAIFQCLPAPSQSQSTHVDVISKGVKRVILTASGGPFLRMPLAELGNVTPDQACAHPKWSMGRKISTDSATLMNKGLELIEAQWLFDLPANALEVVIHPQSIIHSFVDYIDGSMLAQLGNPDMRTPIAQALAYPDRFESGVAPLNLTSMGHLQFEAPDLDRFRCLKLAFDVLKRRGNRACVLNAANEVAVDAFLRGQLPFLRIPRVVEDVLSRLQSDLVPQTLSEVLVLDQEARSQAKQLVIG